MSDSLSALRQVLKRTFSVCLVQRFGDGRGRTKILQRPKTKNDLSDMMRTCGHAYCNVKDKKSTRPVRISQWVVGTHCQFKKFPEKVD